MNNNLKFFPHLVQNTYNKLSLLENDFKWNKNELKNDLSKLIDNSLKNVIKIFMEFQKKCFNEIDKNYDIFKEDLNQYKIYIDEVEILINKIIVENKNKKDDLFFINKNSEDYINHQLNSYINKKYEAENMENALKNVKEKFKKLRLNELSEEIINLSKLVHNIVNKNNFNNYLKSIEEKIEKEINFCNFNFINDIHNINFDINEYLITEKNNEVEKYNNSLPIISKQNLTIIDNFKIKNLKIILNKKIHINNFKNKKITSIISLDQNNIIIGYKNGSLQLVNIFKTNKENFNETYDSIKIAKFDNEVHSISKYKTSDGFLISCCDIDNKLKIININKNKIEEIYNEIFHLDLINFMNFLNQEYLLTLSSDGFIKILNIKTKNEVFKSKNFKSINQGNISFNKKNWAFSNINNYIFNFQVDIKIDNIYLERIRYLKEELEIKGIEFLRNNDDILIIILKNCLKVYNFVNGEIINRIENLVNPISYLTLISLKKNNEIVILILDDDDNNIIFKYASLTENQNFLEIKSNNGFIIKDNKNHFPKWQIIKSNSGNIIEIILIDEYNLSYWYLLNDFN